MPFKRSACLGALEVLQQMPAHAGLYPRAPHLSAVLPALLDQHDARACLDLLLLACSGPRDERGANAGSAGAPQSTSGGDA